MAAAGQAFIGTRNQANVAIVRDYDNEWDGEYDVWHGPFMWKSNKEWYKALQRKHIPNDVFYLRKKTTLKELARYDVLIYSHPAIMTDETASLLEEYVQQGGKLIFGCRTGYKDERGQCYMRPFPGAARDLCGITVEEFTMVKGSRQPTTISRSGVVEVITGADDFNDILKIEEASVEVMAVYASDYYAGKPAVTRNRRGKGEVWYHGAVFNEQAASIIIDQIGLQSPAEWIELPEEVELQIRNGASSSYTFLLNYSETPASIHLLETKTDLLSGTTLSGEVTLEGFGVLILH